MCPVQQLESVWWMEDGENILSSHSDGSYCQWTVTGEDPQTEPVKQEIPYGETTLPESLVFSVIALHTMFNEELTSRLSKKYVLYIRLKDHMFVFWIQSRRTTLLSKSLGLVILKKSLIIYLKSKSFVTLYISLLLFLFIYTTLLNYYFIKIFLKRLTDLKLLNKKNSD